MAQSTSPGAPLATARDRQCRSVHPMAAASGKAPAPDRNWIARCGRSLTGLAGALLPLAAPTLLAQPVAPTANSYTYRAIETPPAKAVLACRDSMTRLEGEADSGDQVYTLKLAAAPDGEVRVTPTSADASKATVAWPGAPNALVFTTADWGTEQHVRVRPTDDDDADHETVAITHEVAGGGYDGVVGPTVTVTVTDDEHQPVGPAPRGRIPNQCYPSDELFTKISPKLSNRHHNQPTVINGYLLLAGNGVHEFWDISNPYAPVRLSELFSPHRFGEAESHQVSYAKFPDGSLYLVTPSGLGIDLWGIDDVRQPELLSALQLPNISYGDMPNSVWGVAWQGDYIYVGATTSGLYIVDASDPSQPKLVNTIPRDGLGGVAAGPLFALGNLLVITTPKLRAGVVTMDISDPANPILLDFVTMSNGSYIGSFYGKNAYLLGPIRTFDVTTDPRNIEQIGLFRTVKSEYVSFGDGHMFLGGLRGGSQGIWKFDVSDPNDFIQIGRIPGRDSRWDDQFSVPIGNVIAISDDQYVGGYVGSFMAVHATEPDTQPPVVDYVNPPDGALDQATSSRIALSFSDQIELASVDSSTLIVRPIGGEALTGKWGHSQTVVTFWPERPLQAETDYEVVAVAGGITDLVGNALANEFRSVFRTGAGSPPRTDGIGAPLAVEAGQDAHFVANLGLNGHEYRWDFGDGQKGTGASVSHGYLAPGRYTVTLSVVGPDGHDVFEAEVASLSGGVVASSSQDGYFGSGFAKYPDRTGSNVKVEWQIERNRAGNADIDVRYAKGGRAELSLDLVVNGITVRAVTFKPTSSARDWQVVTIDDVALNAGNNTLALVAANGIGPRIDRLSLPSETSTVLASYTATQIVHRPLTANGPARSSTVIVTADQARAWTVNPDADTVTAVDTGTLMKAFESDVGLTPRTLAQAPDGTIWVVNEGSYNISVLDPSGGAVIDTIELPYASMPYGIAFAPDGSAAYVSLQALGRLLRIDPATRTIVHSLALGPDGSGIVPKPRGIAIDSDSRRILVTRFVSPDQGGEVYDIGVGGQTTYLTRTIALAIDPGPDTPDGGRGIPNYISSVAISPDGVHARVPSKKDNIERGGFRDGQALTHDNAVRTVISQIDLSSGSEDLAARIDLDDHDMAFAVAFSPLGDLLFTASQGSNVVDVIDAYSGTRVAGIPTRLAPQGLTLDDQGRLYVQNFMSRSLSVFDVAALLTAMESSAQLLAEIDLVATETLTDQVLLGKQIFYDASSSSMSLEGYISCASCHLDGGQDGRTWDFTDRGEGLRNTIPLQGRGGTLLHGPVHWTGNFDEIQDFESDIRSHFGGSGFMSDDDFNSGTRDQPLGDPKAGLSAELDALAAYVSSLTSVPLSPYRNADGSLTVEAELGKQVFVNTGCNNCHGGAGFTDSALGVLHDVGTIKPASGGRLGESLTGIDTPTLKGVWATAPYLHDGSASTLAQAIDAHSDVSISGSELDALVSYLQQIDELEPPIPAPVATFAVTVAPEAIAEGESATLTVAITNGVTFAQDQSVALAVTGTVSASDYSGVPAALTLAAGTSSATVELTASNDQEEEADETLTVEASLGGVSIGAATVTIASVSHDATLSALSLSGIDIGLFSSTVTAYASSVGPRVESTTVTATASHPEAEVSIAPGAAVSLAEGANQITVTVTAEDGTTTQAYTVTVTRAGMPEVSIAAVSSPVTEGAVAAFDVRLAEAAFEALTVAVSVTESGSMLSGTPPASVAFPRGGTSVTLSVPTAGDLVAEADSAVTAVVAAGTGYIAGAASWATVTVEDDDAATFTLTAVPDAIAEGESATLTVAIANGVTFAEDQTVALAVSGTVSAADYTGVPAALTLAAGTSSATVDLTASDDQEEEADETLTVEASLGGVPVGAATLTIANVSHDATLSALSLAGIDIGTFSSTATSYTARVGHGVESTTVTATASHPEAEVSIAPGAAVSLAEGANQITVTVTAEDGTTTQTYTLTVRRRRLPVVSISAVEERLPEGEMAGFTVSRTGPTTEPLDVQVHFASTTSEKVQTLTIRLWPGQTSVTERVQGSDDTIVEDDVTVTWTLAEDEHYTLSAENASASVVLEDNDVPEFSVSANPAEIAEGESATLTVAITNGVTFRQAQTIALSVSGTASASDYAGVPATLTLNAYKTTATFSTTATLTASVDREEEADETVTIAASHDGSPIGSATVTIASVSHDATLSGLSLSGIDIGTFSGAVTSYAATVDHAVESTTVTATATHPEASVSTVPGTTVSLAEGDNEITVTVAAEDGTTTQIYTVTVRREAAPSLPVVSIAAVASPLAEGELAEFRLSRTGPATEELTVNVRVNSRPYSMRFRPGQTSKTGRTSVHDDTVVEDDVTVTWRLQEGEGYQVSEEAAEATVILEENDVPEFSVSADPAEIAEGESATLTVAITNGVTFAEDQTLALELSGTASTADYRVTPAAPTLVAGTSSATAVLAALVDQEEEADETVTIAASHGGSPIGSATVTISSVSHEATLSGLGLSGIDIGTFSGAVTSYEASVDHAVESTTVTATATHPEASVSITPGTAVSLAEGDNEITVTVAAEDGTTTQKYTVTVTRAAAPSLPVVSIAAVASPVAEGELAEFRLSRTGPATEELTVNVRVNSRPYSMRFRPGQTSKTGRTSVHDDTVVEDDVTVTWRLQEGEGYQVSEEAAEATVILEENDVAEFALSVDPAEVDEGDSATVRVRTTNGVTFAESQTIALDFAGSTATAGTDYTLSPGSLTLPAGARQATATLTAIADSDSEDDETVSLAASHGGEAIGTATLTIADAEFTPLTAQFLEMPETHDGSTFRFKLQFSEPVGLTNQALRSTVFAVTGGAVRAASRVTPGVHVAWWVRVRPASDADVVVVLPVTADCAAAGAVCTASGKPLSTRLEVTVKGPGSEVSGQGFSLAPENSSPSGIWSDGETAWVADLADARLYAYQREDGERQPGKDFATEPSPMGLWSDGETLWVAQLGGGLRAYRLADGARLPDRDLALAADVAPAGVWSDGETAWVSGWLGDTVHAYRLEDGRRAAGRDIKLAGGNLLPMGLWSDGETLWVADWRERMYAYRLSDGNRVPELDLGAGSKDEDPSGLWSGGGTLLSTNWESDEVRAYPVPEAEPRSMDASGLKDLGGMAGSVPPIADPALLAAIRAALGKAPGESLSAVELAGLETLQACNGGIRDLAGLERATSLKELDLGFNPVADLRPLALLPMIESLNLDGAAPDLQPLASLAGLKRLSLRNNAIADLQALASLTGLTELDVGDNRIADLSPLAGLTRLTVFRADRNRIADLWPLASLAGLEALELGANRIRDLQPLAGLTQLRALRLEGNGLTELYPLAGLERLRDLGLAANGVESVRALADLGGLRRLDLRGTAVEDLRPLSAMPSLVWVHVGGSQITDLAPLDSRSGLTVAGREDRDSPTGSGEDDARERRQ